MENYEPKRVEYRTVDEIMESAVPCSIREDIQRQFELERGTKGPLDLDRIRAAENWNDLGSLVIGQEHLGPQIFP